MSSSDLSDLSSSLSSNEDILSEPIPKGKVDHYFKPGSSATKTSPPVKKKRPPSPPHEYVLADNPDIAFICMFRSRFSDAFPKSLPHYGPQDIERGVVDSIAGEQVEKLLCALLGLVLNRKKDIERGHYQRALEEAVQSNNSQWPGAWNGKNPLHGGGNFNKMTPDQRLTLLKALIIWSLGSSEAIQAIVKDAYKQQRHDDDLNQPLSVQPWGRDGDKRRFWLVEGQDDTHFRLYRESNPALKHNTWRSVAGTIDELKEVAQRLGEENTQASRRLRDRITAGVPRFEASEEKRKRRDYRMARKAQFTRPEPGFSLYEGRTRGKRIRYTYSDEEDGGSDALSTRRSNRHSGISTPAEPNGPTFTASGRQIRARHGGAYGETMLSGQTEGSDQPGLSGLDGAEDDVEQPVLRGRPRRTTQPNGAQSKARSRKHIDGYNSLDSMDDESDATSSGGGWDGEDDDDADDHAEDEDDDDVEMSDDEASLANGVEVADEEDGDDDQKSLVVSLRYSKPQASPLPEKTRNVQSSSKYYSTPPSIPVTSNSTSGLSYPTQISVDPPKDVASAPSKNDSDSPQLVNSAIQSQYDNTVQSQAATPNDLPLNTILQNPQQAVEN